MTETVEPWSTPAARRWVRLLLDSHTRLAGEPLVATPAGGDPAAALWSADLVVVSHRMSDDPVFVYANQAALALWSMSWESFTAMPSRLSAEPDQRDDRAAALAEVAATGITHGYGGIRVTSDGRRFRIEGVTLWNVLDDDGALVGQAAAFPTTVAWL